MITYESPHNDKRVKLGNMYFTCIWCYNRGIKVAFPDWPPSILSCFCQDSSSTLPLGFRSNMDNSINMQVCRKVVVSGVYSSSTNSQLVISCSQAVTDTQANNVTIYILNICTRKDKDINVLNIGWLTQSQHLEMDTHIYTFYVCFVFIWLYLNVCVCLGGGGQFERKDQVCNSLKCFPFLWCQV